MKYTLIMLLWCITIMANAQPPNNPIFGGGNADGFDKALFAQAGNPIFNGGEGDGFAKINFAQAGGNIFIGGDGDGFSQANFAQPGTNIFNGGDADGWSFGSFAQAGNNIFKGGDGDGWSFINFAQAASNIFNGGLGDGWASTYRPLGPLPITILSFTAEKTGQSSLLKWQTADAKNFDRFVVERSADAVNFVRVGEVAATNATTYKFTDGSPLKGNNYYRLKLLDSDGSFKYTPVRVLNFGSEGLQMQVYPNPVRTITNLVFTKEMAAQNLAINIMNANGQIVYQQRVYVTGAQAFKIDISGLPAATYYLHVKGQTISASATLIKL